MDDVHIVFTATPTPLGALIRKITKSPVSHVMIEVSVWGKKMVAEATFHGTRFVPSKKFKRNVIREYLCKFDSTKGLSEIAGHFGTPYDFTGLFVIAWVKLLWAWFKYRFKKFKWKNKSIKCSELGVMFLKANELEGVSDFNLELTTQDDLLVFCENNKKYFEVVS
jgi:hypothetical protein